MKNYQIGGFAMCTSFHKLGRRFVSAVCVSSAVLVWGCSSAFHTPPPDTLLYELEDPESPVGAVALGDDWVIASFGKKDAVGKLVATTSGVYSNAQAQRAAVVFTTDGMPTRFDFDGTNVNIVGYDWNNVHVWWSDGDEWHIEKLPIGPMREYYEWVQSIRQTTLAKSESSWRTWTDQSEDTRNSVEQIRRAVDAFAQSVGLLNDAPDKLEVLLDAFEGGVSAGSIAVAGVVVLSGVGELLVPDDFDVQWGLATGNALPLVTRMVLAPLDYFAVDNSTWLALDAIEAEALDFGTATSILSPGDLSLSPLPPGPFGSLGNLSTPGSFSGSLVSPINWPERLIGPPVDWSALGDSSLSGSGGLASSGGSFGSSSFSRGGFGTGLLGAGVFSPGGLPIGNLGAGSFGTGSSFSNTGFGAGYSGGSFGSTFSGSGYGSGLSSTGFRP